MKADNTTLAQDALAVLGDDYKDKVDALEAERVATKSDVVPDGAVIKTEDTKTINLPAAEQPIVQVAAEPVDKAKREDVSEADKKRATEEYGNVEYADEQNKKYPIDTEEHIRAAWSYIGMPKNSSKYPDDGAAIKRKIVSAWKKTIDKEGPPKAEEKSEAEEQPTVAPVVQPVMDELTKAVNLINELAQKVSELDATVKSQAATLEALNTSDEAKLKSAIENGGIWAKFNTYSATKDPGTKDKTENIKGPAKTVVQEGVWSMFEPPQT